MQPVRRPNIVYVLADDMGFGDASCLNPAGKIRTTRLDRFARQGMTFTDAHSTSAVCTPSRYSILTGRYNWRSTLQRGIVEPYGKALIARDRLTVPTLLQSLGYHTACVGKWHLGQSWPLTPTPDDFFPRPPSATHDLTPTPRQLDLWRDAFSQPIADGPTTRGFHEYFGVDVPNWPPYCFIENDRTLGIPTQMLPSRLVGNNLATFTGPAMPDWCFERLLPALADRSDQVIAQNARAGRPFFLYLPLTSPHTPLSVNEAWAGKSGLDSRYADLVLETDDVFGRVLDSLERHGVADNTLVIFASDNGCAHYIGAADLEARGHFPSAGFRGYKSDAWDGGHRIPFLARWPGVIAPGSACGQLVSLADLMATLADALGAPLPPSAGEDSVSLMPLFRDPRVKVRDHLVHHSYTGKFALRDGRWKLVLCPGSGGWSYNDDQAARDGRPPVQLYDLGHDPGEKTNLEARERGRVREMIALLERLITEGRSTPGPHQPNDAPIDLWKLESMPSLNPAALDDY